MQNYPVTEFNLESHQKEMASLQAETNRLRETSEQLQRNLSQLHPQPQPQSQPQRELSQGERIWQGIMAKTEENFNKSQEAKAIHKELDTLLTTWLENNDRGRQYSQKVKEIQDQAKLEFMKHSQKAQELLQQKEKAFSSYMTKVLERLNEPTVQSLNTSISTPIPTPQEYLSNIKDVPPLEGVPTWQ